MGAFTWVIVCAVVFLYDAGTHVISANSADDIGLTDGKELDQNFLEEGRGHKKHKKKIINMVIAMKIVILSLIIPKILALTLFASWKGITLSLVALAVACVSWKHPHHGGRGEETHAHFLKKNDDHAQIHQHWWRKIREAEPIYEDEDNYVGPYHQHHHNDY